MEQAVELAQNCVSEEGRISPKVGAVIARGGVLLGGAYRGELRPGDHAEYTLIKRKLKSETLAGATLFTTLEPCTTGRRHPKRPCAEWIIESCIARVVIGVLDPNDAICGRGLRRLMGAGIEVALFDLDLSSQIEELNHEFTRDQEDKQRTRTRNFVLSPFLGDRLLDERIKWERAGAVRVEMDIAGPPLYEGAIDRVLRTHKAYNDVSSVELVITSDAGVQTYVSG